jgi:alpha-beta hydrolase superfamily lysophospholipase
MRAMTSQPAVVNSIEAADGTLLAYRRFEPTGAGRAALIHLHGIQSHGLWYEETAATLAERGFAVYLTDRRGSGASGGVRGHAASHNQLIEDVHRFRALAAEQHPDLPIFLLGCCWGAKPALATALAREQAFAGMALISPALRTKVGLSAWDSAKVAVGRVVAPQLRVPLPLTPEMFTRDPDRIAFIRDDELGLHDASAQFLFDSFLWDHLLLRRAKRLRLPLLLLQSDTDPIVDTEAVKRWFGDVAATDKEAILYSDFDHLLDFDARRDQFRTDLLAWLEARCDLSADPSSAGLRP